MNLRDLKLRARAVLSPRRVESDLGDELAFHVDREAAKHVALGKSPAEARALALRRFGSVPGVADQCRDARGTALLDNLVRDLLFAARSFRRAPLAALTIVATLALGLGLVTVVFTCLNELVFRPDEVRDPHELFAVERQRSASAEREGFTRPQYDTLVREVSVFSVAFAMAHVDSRAEGRKIEGALVSGNFFQALGVNAEMGRLLAPSDDEGPGSRVIVLSHRGWSQRFAGDPSLLHRSILLDGVPFQVIGITPKGFRGLTVAAPDFWAPLGAAAQFPRLGPAEQLPVEIVGRLRAGLSREQAAAELRVWDERQARAASDERPRTSLLLEPRAGTVPLSTDVLVLFTPLFFAFGLVLMIGCANVANLLLARAVARQREMGIRLAIGASRRRIVAQLLAEAFLLALVAAALAFGVSRIVLQGVVHLVTTTFPPGMGDVRLAVPPADWRIALFLVAGALASTLAFALVPALQATRVSAVRAMRGEVLPDARPGRARSALVVLQVAASVLLLIGSAVFLRGAWASAAVDPGIRTSDIVTVSVLDERTRRATLDAVRSEPVVTGVAAAWPGVVGGRTALGEGADGQSTVAYQCVSPEYFGVLGISIVHGRGFAPGEDDASGAVAVVSESVARELWPGKDAVGQVLRIAPDAKSDASGQPRPEPAHPEPLARAYAVVGIARDVPGFRFVGARLPGAGVYLPTSSEASGTSLVLRVTGHPDRAARLLGDRLAAAGDAMSEVATLKTMADMEGYLLRIAFWLTLASGALALGLTLSGLFSVLSYLVEQRTREIGVRLALGSTRGGIGALVLSQSARPVGIGMLIGASLTAALGAVLLATPAAEEIGSVVRLYDPVAYAASLFCVITACAGAALVPALRAGRTDPIGALRQD